MSFFDILKLSLRNLREARLRAVLTTLGVVIGVAVIVTMVSFGLGLQRNTVSRFKELDLFNEVTVFGRSLSSLVAGGFKKNANATSEGEPRKEKVGQRMLRPDKAPERPLDDAAIAEISKIPGVESVEPAISFTAYVRSNGTSMMRSIGGAIIPNPSSRFKEFDAGAMISSASADEVVVDANFVHEFGYAKPADAIGKTIDLLAPPTKKQNQADDTTGDEDDQLSFFGLPLEEDDAANKNTADSKDSHPANKSAATDALVAKTFRIVGVLKGDDEFSGRGPRFSGFMPPSDMYVPLPAARAWTLEHRDDLSQVALQLARASGAIGENEATGYGSAVASTILWS
jgi:hypothetical protein